MRKICACVLKKMIPVRLGQWAESDLMILYLTFFFFWQKFASVCAQVEDGISFNIDY